MELFNRLEKHISRTTESGCWLWTGATNEGGYGRVAVNGQNKHAHRVLFEILKGAIEDGKVLDHLCRVRCCVNPDHLEPVTIKENIKRGDQTNKGWRRLNTHCKKGHELIDANVYKKKSAQGNAHRVCKTCHGEWRNYKGALN